MSAVSLSMMMPRSMMPRPMMRAARQSCDDDRPAGPENVHGTAVHDTVLPGTDRPSAAERAPDARCEGSEQRRRSSATPSSGATEQRSRWGTIGSRHQTGSDGRVATTSNEESPDSTGQSGR